MEKYISATAYRLKKDSRLRIFNNLLHKFLYLNKMVFQVCGNQFPSFSFYLGFFHEHSQFIGKQGKGEIFLTTLYHFHWHHRYQPGNYCRGLSSVHIQQLGSSLESLISERKLLTTKLRALKKKRKKQVFTYFIIV